MLDQLKRSIYLIILNSKLYIKFWNFLKKYLYENLNQHYLYNQYYNY